MMLALLLLAAGRGTLVTPRDQPDLIVRFRPDGSITFANGACARFYGTRREALIGLGLERVNSSGYVYLVELAYVAHKLGYRLTEVPIHFPDRVRGESKMNGRVMIEAALRVWQIRFRHKNLTPDDRMPDETNFVPEEEYYDVVFERAGGFDESLYAAEDVVRMLDRFVVDLARPSWPLNR